MSGSAHHYFRGVGEALESGAEPYWTRTDLKHMDEKFSNRLARAIATGKEHAPIGVITAPGTEHPVYCLPVSGGVRRTVWSG